MLLKNRSIQAILKMYDGRYNYQIMVERKEMEPVHALNFVLLPNLAITERSIELSRQIGQQIPTEFTLDKANYRPHITIYQGYFPERNLKKLFEVLQSFSDRANAPEIEMADFVVSRETFISWNTSKTDQLQEFHEMLVDQANVLREGLIPPSVEGLRSTLTEEETEMVEQTGSILNRQLFTPHVTLTRIVNPQDGSKVMNILGNSEKAFFTPESIVVAQLGNHGTISSTVREFSLVK